MTRRQVFVDSWGWVALAAKDDAAHPRAVAVRRDVIRSGAKLVTSDLVLAESLTRLRYDMSLAAALVLVGATEVMVAEDALAIVYLDSLLWQAALAWFRRYDDQRFSFVDCTSFAIMHARGINDALTADRHFATAGFVPLG